MACRSTKQADHLFGAECLVLRNISPTCRQYYMHMFAWLGKITLETYIAQVLSNSRLATPSLHPHFTLASLHHRLALLCSALLCSNLPARHLFGCAVQFHIWMSSTGPGYTNEPNAAPKRLLCATVSRPFLRRFSSVSRHRTTHRAQ